MSSENPDSDTQVDHEDEKQDAQEKNANPAKAEEAKLKAKYPALGQRPGGSDFLMKRLQKGQAKADRSISLSPRSLLLHWKNCCSLHLHALYMLQRTSTSGDC
ncbi:endosulfine alpha b isoform X2 [Paralichthys olivaceus]|uniref:endosulfine alpha b isoform X2 n=1 Tax=Paralichthys olivaceus TaxID=8255 RepID=UPI00097DBF63|nr:PREDICTED: alpha-endosulfine isoform X2 [Paralichthys olivaceus]